MNRMMIMATTITISLNVIACGCRGGGTVANQSHANSAMTMDQRRSFEIPPVSSDGAPVATSQTSDSYAGYFFSLGVTKRKNLAENIESLKFGDDIDTVKKRVGIPDRSGDDGAKDFIPRIHRRMCLGYDVARYREHLVTEGKDVWVDLIFDFNGRLEGVASTYPAVKERWTEDAWKSSLVPRWWLKMWPWNCPIFEW